VRRARFLVDGLRPLAVGVSCLSGAWLTKGVLLRVFDGFDGEIDIEVWPVQVMRTRQLDVRDFANGRLPEPGKSLKGTNSSRSPTNSQNRCDERR
jgi:hypothetical protein